MSRTSAQRHFGWLLPASLMVALALTALPLPGLGITLRPDWMALVILYWALFAPRALSLWIIVLSGLCLDVLLGTLLGQHALALVIMCYLPLKLHLRMRVFSGIQLSAAVFGLIWVYEFILFWVNGVANQTTYFHDYWVPVLTSTVIWPVVLLLMDGVVAHRAADR